MGSAGPSGPRGRKIAGPVTSRVAGHATKQMGPSPPLGPVVLVVAAEPEPLLVAAFRRAIEPLVHAPDSVHSARVGGVRVVHDAILEHEGAQPWPIAMVRGR